MLNPSPSEPFSRVMLRGRGPLGREFRGQAEAQEISSSFFVYVYLVLLWVYWVLRVGAGQQTGAASQTLHLRSDGADVCVRHHLENSQKQNLLI